MISCIVLRSVINELNYINNICIEVRGAGTMLYVGGPTNTNKYCGKSGGDQYIGGPPRF